MKLITFFSAGILIVLSGLHLKKENTEPVPLYNTKWLLKKIHTDSGAEPVNTNAFIRFDSAKQSAGGNGSCNQFGSNFTLSKDSITFSHLFSTKMYCEAVQQTEDLFLKQLGEVTRLEQRENKLHLYSGDKLVLEFEAHKTTKPAI